MGGNQVGDDAEQGRFAGPGDTDQGDEFAFIDADVEVVENGFPCFPFAKGDCQVPGFDYRCHARILCWMETKM